MTLIAVMRGRDFEVFTHPERILEQVAAHVA
jgi:FdhD protein